MPTCADITPYLRSVSLIKDCDLINANLLRIATVFQQVNGSYIDLFLKTKDGLWEELFLTDLGETTAYLLDLHVKIWTTEKKKQAVADICDSLDVMHVGGEFQIKLQNLDELPMAMVRLSQVCIRVSDLAVTSRFRSVSIFKEDVTDFLDSNDLIYKSNVIIPGRHDNQVSIDFEVTGQRVKTLILTLSSPNEASVHGLSTEVFRKWYDIQSQTQQYQFVTLYDAYTNVIRNEDLERIRDFSTTFGFPAEEETIKLALAA